MTKKQKLKEINKLINSIFEKNNIDLSIAESNYWEAVNMVRLINVDEANQLIGLSAEVQKNTPKKKAVPLQHERNNT